MMRASILVDHDDRWIVICRTDKIGARKGPYVLATRQVFNTENDAKQYSYTISQSREPLIVSGPWRTLRFDSEE